MKITYNWLKELVDFDFSPAELADKLSMLGLEVELVVPVKPAFANVVVGRIKEITRHPSADKLILCKIDIGKEILDIVCGARNVKEGDHVPVALVGGQLANGMKMIKKKIRGIESSGMLCSEQELGFGDGPEGIFILSEKNLQKEVSVLGLPLESVLPIEDSILDIAVTANRGDALSLIGIAREISALTGNPLKLPPDKPAESGKSVNKLLTVKLAAKDLCPRYTARVITGIKIEPSPFWLRYRLNLLGLRSINNVVDITNYVLLETGQPLHAFDYQLIAGKTIIVRQAEKKEKITTIDEEKRTLDQEMLVIADQQKPVALGGVIGGKDTEVNPETKDILLESAYFQPTSIRRTAKKLAVMSDSSYRFERGVDPHLAPIASGRAAQLILKLAGGELAKGIIDQKGKLPVTPKIKFDPAFCNRVLGTDITRKEMTSILKSLGCKIQAQLVHPPSYRPDLIIPVDLVEEIARFHGYPNIPASMPEAMIISKPLVESYSKITSLKRLLCGLGLTEIITYSFTAPDALARMEMTLDNKQLLAIKNPVSKDTSIMRTSLLPGLMKTISQNINKGNTDLRLFEVGKCFFPLNNEELPREEMQLSIGISSDKGNKGFFQLKGILEEILERLFVKTGQFPKSNQPALHPGRTCAININNKQIGFFGELHPKVLRNYDITQPVWLAELRIVPLLAARDLPPKYAPLPKFPGIRRDIAIIVDKQLESYDIIKTVRDIQIKILESINVFDVYQGDPIPAGKKSLAFALIYRHPDRTLTDEEVNNIHKLVQEKILAKHIGEIRI